VNGYNRIDFAFYDMIKNREESERRYEMVIEMWPFTSLQYLSIDVKNAVALLEKNTLKKLQKLRLDCGDLRKKEVVSSLVQLFDVLRKNQLELKELLIYRSGGDSDEDEHISSMPRFPFFSYVDGLRNLIIRRFVIVENPGDGFKFLKRLELDCVLQCDVCHFDGVGSLKLWDCKGIKGLSALKITRHVHIYGEFHPNDEYSTASSLVLTTAEDGFEPVIDLAQYERAHSLHLTAWADSKVIVPEKLSDNLKSLSLHGFVPFKDHLPPNNLRYLEFRNSRLEDQIYQIPNLSNIEQVRLVSCELTSLEILGSGIKDIAVSFCHLEDYSPLGRCEKVSIERCDIPHTLRLSEVKELTIRNCKFTFDRELDGSLIPFLSDCPKLEVLDVDFLCFDRYDMVATEFPSLKKIVLKGVDAKSIDADVFPFPGFCKCWMPRQSLYRGEITYLLRMK